MVRRSPAGGGHRRPLVRYSHGFRPSSIFFPDHFPWQCRCDRILWQGDGIEQLQYLRGESRFSDHRPVCGVFAVEVDGGDGDGGGAAGKIMKGYYSLNARIGGDRSQCHQGDVS